MANAAQNLKARSSAARTANAAAIKAQNDAALARLTVLLTTTADQGKEIYALPSSDPDYPIWSSEAGKEYISSRGFTVMDVNYANDRVLQINWDAPTPDPIVKTSV